MRKKRAASTHHPEATLLQPKAPRPQINRIVVVDVSPTGTIALGSWDNQVRILSPEGEQSFVYTAHTDAVSAVAWSPDGRWIASGSWDRTVRVWTSSTGELHWIHSGHTAPISAIAWSPNGHLLASASMDETVQVVNETGAPVCTYHKHDGPVYGIGWSRHSNTIASGGADGIVHVWTPSSSDRVETRAAYYLEQSTGQKQQLLQVDTLAWSPNGRWIAVVGHDLVQIWKSKNGTVLTSHTHQEPVNALRWSHDSTRIATTSDHEARVWDATNGQTLATYRKPEHTGTLWGVAWLPDDRGLLVGRQGYRPSEEQSPPGPDTLQELPLNEKSLQMAFLPPEPRHALLARRFRQWVSVAFS